MADFGCGPGVTLLELAELYTDTSFHGFETSNGLVNWNKREAAERGLQNVSFAVTKLPTVPNRLAFDLVLCIATLHYVENRLRALRNLFEAQSALARAVQEKGEYVLPVRFDDSELPGLLPTIKYLWAKDYTPDQLAEIMRSKLEELK